MTTHSRGSRTGIQNVNKISSLRYGHSASNSHPVFPLGLDRIGLKNCTLHSEMLLVLPPGGPEAQQTDGDPTKNVRNGPDRIGLKNRSAPAFGNPAQRRCCPLAVQKCGRQTLAANSSEMTVIHSASTKKMYEIPTW